MNIAVTFPPDSEERETLIKILGSVARVVFLTDLSSQDRGKELAQADILFSGGPARELQHEDYKGNARLKMMQILSAGADYVPWAKLPSNLIIASNPGAYAEQMAEHVLAMILAATKNLLDRDKKLRNGVFDQSNVNRMLRGSTCAILGFGGIGKATARLLRCFEVKILGVNTTGKADDPVDFIGTLKDLQYVLRLADIVVIALPLTNLTRRLIGTQELAWMKEDAILVNVARGQIIDEEALYHKLKACPKFTAAIDVWWTEPWNHGQFHTNYPFLDLPNIIGSPHNSSVVVGAFLTATRMAAENVKRFLNHEPVLGIVGANDYQ